MPTTTSSKIASEAGRWYKPDATQVNEVIAKNGQPRKPTIADVRKNPGWVPSVTTILSEMLVRKWLTEYKVNQALMAAITLPRPSGISDDEFLELVKVDAAEHSNRAMERGREIHASIEKYLRNEAIPDSDETCCINALACVEANVPTFRQETIDTERSFYTTQGWGGTIDLLISGESPVVIDFKTTDGDVEKKKGSDDHQLQLVAYRDGMGLTSTTRLVNVYISTKTGECKWVEYQDNDRYSLIWNHLVDAYYLLKGLNKT